MTDEQELTEKLNGYIPPPNSNVSVGLEVSKPSPPSSASSQHVDFSQWQILANGKFRPGARTVSGLAPGVYRIGTDEFGPYLECIKIVSDSIIELPEPAHMRVLAGIRKFWESRSRYDKHGLLYKRGILLWGPPGGGKTVTMQLLSQEIISKHRGIVLLDCHPGLTVNVLHFFRRIEPTRPLIVIFEDVDETISSYGEHALLSILDGEHQTDNVVYLASTNYPERLGARIINRPSRFDERIKIGMPSYEARMTYLSKAAAGASVPVSQWAYDTEGLSIAHLRELVVAVLCLDQEYDDVVTRLKAMGSMVKPESGFNNAKIGLLYAQQAQTVSSR